MERVDFKKLVLEILITESPVSFTAEDLFNSTKNNEGGHRTPYSSATDYNKCFAVSYPDGSTIDRILTFFKGILPLSRGGVAGFDEYAAFFPFVDLLCLVIETNGIKTGELDTKKLEDITLKTGSSYAKWFDKLKISPFVGADPLDWDPISAKGVAIKKQLTKDGLQKYAAQLSLKSYKVQSIMFAITQLLEVRKELRWNTFKTTSTLKIPFTKTRDRQLPKKVYQIFEDPQKYSSGKTKFPADIANRYDTSGGLEDQIYDLALAAQFFFDTEKQLYFGTEADECSTVLIDLLENRITEAGSSDGLFHFMKADGNAIPADKGIGKGGYTIGNLEAYSNSPDKKAAKELWDQLVRLANYTATATFSWKDVLGGARSTLGAISSFGGKFGT